MRFIYYSYVFGILAGTEIVMRILYWSKYFIAVEHFSLGLLPVIHTRMFLSL